MVFTGLGLYFPGPVDTRLESFSFFLGSTIQSQGSGPESSAWGPKGSGRCPAVTSYETSFHLVKVSNGRALGIVVHLWQMLLYPISSSAPGYLVCLLQACHPSPLSLLST